MVINVEALHEIVKLTSPLLTRDGRRTYLWPNLSNAASGRVGQRQSRGQHHVRRSQRSLKAAYGQLIVSTLQLLAKSFHG